MMPQCNFFIYLSTFLVFSNVYLVCSDDTPRCNLRDSECLKKAANAVVSQLMEGIPSLQVDTSDPLTLPFISTEASGLKYTFTDSIVGGFKSCKIDDIRFEMDKFVMHIEVICRLSMAGKYEMQGRLLILPVNGKGQFKMVTGDVKLIFDTDLQMLQNKDGSSHLHIKKFKLQEPDVLEPVKFDFTNLFNGNKVLSDAVISFANENYKEVAREVSTPIFAADLKLVMKNVNKYLKTIKIEPSML